MLGKHICKIPWAGFSNNPDGTVKPCCIFKENIKKTDGSDYYVQNDDVKDIFHSDYMNNLRQEFLDGNQPSPCETCWIDESNGYKSKREIYNEIYTSYDVDCETNKPTVDYPIDYQLIISNACNLKCRSCGSSHSTQWQKEINTLPDNVPGANDYVFKYDMPYGQVGGRDSVFINEIEKWCSKVKRLEVVGGEPFYIEKWKTIFNFLMDNGYAKDIDLSMSTNATIFNEELLIKMSNHFKFLGIGLSIDGMGKTYDYLRKNGSWDEVKSNILRFYQFYRNKTSEKDYNGHSLSMNYTYTISWLNAYDLPEFHSFVKNNTPEFRIWNNIVHYPAHMSIDMLPNDEKQRIQDKWDMYDWGVYTDDIKSVLSFMWSKEYTDEEIKEQFLNFKFFDYIRQENTYNIIKDNHPNLLKYLE